MAASVVVRAARYRAWLVVAGLLVVGAALAVYTLPEIVRRVVIARVEALTGRRAAIERVDVNLLSGRFTLRGFRLADREGQAPFADFTQLDLRLHLPSLVVGHVWIREMVLSDPTVRVVRLATNEFNFSDLLGRSASAEGPSRDLTVDHFVLRRGTVTLEDRAVPVPRTWASQDIAIEARNVSTRRNDGTAVGTAVTAGAPVSVTMTDMRLYPIHLRATMAVKGLDVTLAQVYLPPGTIVVDRGRGTSSLSVTLDAREGIRADGTTELEDVVMRRADDPTPLAVVPKLTTAVSGFAFQQGNVRIAQLALDGAVRVRDPVPKHAGRLRNASVRGTVADLTWPATTPGRLELVSLVDGGGRLEVTGTLRPPPDPTQLRLRATRLDLAPWAQLLPLDARVSGIAEADLHMNEPLGAGIPARVQGSMAVNRLAVADERQGVLGAQRIEASGLTLHWPTRVVIDRVLVSGPRGIVERDRTGELPLKTLLRRPAPASPTTPASAAAPPLGVEVGEIVVRNGAVAWRDHAVSPAARLDVASVDASIKGIGWPLRGPAIVRASVRPPGGGRVQVTGRVDLEPVAADLRVVAKDAALAPYQPYLRTPARISGAADLDIALVVPSLAERRATARGSAGLSRLDVRDRERTVLRLERAAASGLDVEWPDRITVRRLALTQPWMLLERDEKGALPLRALLPGRAGADASASTAGANESGANTEDDPEALAVSIAQLSVERGGMRVVDRAVSPHFAVDLQSATLGIQGLSTAAATPARLDVSGQLGPGAELRLRGTLGPLGGPLRLDVSGQLREFAVPRTNPYLLQHVGWKTTAGRLTTAFQCRIDGDALSAKTSIKVSRLQLVRAAPDDGAEKRVGLPLGMLTSLMKDKRGDINVSFPVGGRLSDPRFDFSDAIWSAVRTVAINAITLPVSWIGRVHFHDDSRIERIEVRPVLFEAGTPDLTPEGREQVARLAAFLDQLPEVRMSLTPVISARDVDALRRRQFAQRFPERPIPESMEAILAALQERELIPAAEVRKLASDRLDAVRAPLKQAGIDSDRLAEMKPVQRDGAGGLVELEVLEVEGPRRSKVREALDRIRGLVGGGYASP